MSNKLWKSAIFIQSQMWCCWTTFWEAGLRVSLRSMITKRKVIGCLFFANTKSVIYMDIFMCRRFSFRFIFFLNVFNWNYLRYFDVFIWVKWIALGFLVFVFYFFCFVKVIIWMNWNSQRFSIIYSACAVHTVPRDKI